MARSVLFVHQAGGSIGGAERYLGLLGSGLSTRGVRTHLVVLDTRPPAGARAAEALEGAFNSVRPVGGAVALRALAGERRRHRADLIHWNFPDPFAFSGAMWLMVPWGAPSVLTDHLPMMRAGPHREIPRAVANRVVAAVIVVGRAAAAAATDHYGRLPNLCVVPNGVPRPNAPARGPGRAGDGRLRLLFVGRLEDQKDPAFALDVLRVLRDRGEDASLRLVGDGSRRAALETRAREMGLADGVSFAGFVGDPSVEMAAADILLAPSRFEGAPLVPREALAVALPVLLSDIPAHRELLDRGSLLETVPLGRAAAWADAVIRLSRSLDAARAEAGRLGERHGVDTMVEGTIDAYRLADRRHQRHQDGDDQGEAVVDPGE